MQPEANFNLLAIMSIFLGGFLILHIVRDKKHLIALYLCICALDLMSFITPCHSPSSFALAQVALLLLLSISSYCEVKFYTEKIILFTLWISNIFHNFYWLLNPFKPQFSYLVPLTYNIYVVIVHIMACIILIIVVIKLSKTQATIHNKRLYIGCFLFITNYLIFCILLFLRYNIITIKLFSGWLELNVSSLITLVLTSYVGFIIVQKSSFFQITLIRQVQNSGKKDNILTSNHLSDKHQDIYNQLTDLLQREQIYLKESVTLTYLSDKLKVKKQVLSEVIYVTTGMKYYDFINSMRVEEFKKMLHLEIDQKLSIEGMAKQLGFKSKSTFYKHFKKMEGCTPKEYKQRVKT